MAADRQYGRSDVDFETWYSSWMKSLATQFTRDELENKRYVVKREALKAGASHLRAIESSTSMTSNSARRAHARNVVAAAGDYAIALDGAIEIHDLFPEHAKSGKKAGRD
jgi:hypothetical protein